jgi:hypothetical protein
MIVAFHRADVSPIMSMIPITRQFVATKIVPIYPSRATESRQYISAEVMPAILVTGILFQRLEQDIRVEYVVTHGYECPFRFFGKWYRVRDLLLKTLNAPPGINNHGAELPALIHRHRQACHRDVRALFEVVADHVAHIHRVDVIGTEDQYEVRTQQS